MAVTLGFVRPELVERALRIQDVERRRGIEPLPIGELLVNLGVLTREQQSVVTRALPAPNPHNKELARLRLEVAQLRAELEKLTEAMIDKEDLIQALRDALEAAGRVRRPQAA